MAGHDFFANRQNYFLNVSSTFRGGLYAALLIGLVNTGYRIHQRRSNPRMGCVDFQYILFL